MLVVQLAVEINRVTAGPAELTITTASLIEMRRHLLIEEWRTVAAVPPGRPPNALIWR